MGHAHVAHLVTPCCILRRARVKGYVVPSCAGRGAVDTGKYVIVPYNWRTIAVGPCGRAEKRGCIHSSSRARA